MLVRCEDLAMTMRWLAVVLFVVGGVRGVGQAVGGGVVFHGGPEVAGFPVVLDVDAREIAGRAVQVDAAGKLLPWPMAESTGYSYPAYFLSQWAVLQDQMERQRLPYFYCCFAIEPGTYELRPDKGWANSTGYLRAMMEGFVERLYPYTGDRHEVELLEQFFDYEMAHGTTPIGGPGDGYQWAGVPYPSGDPGAAEYRGWSAHGVDFVEPHVVGEDGYAYLRLWEMTGEERYLKEAIRCAEALKKNYVAGDAVRSPWPYRCHAKDGSLEGGKGMFGYSANVVEPVMLLDELIRLGKGDVAGFTRVRDGAWKWLMEYPMKNNVWVGYFEDVTASMDSMNNVIPLETARYLLMHPEKDVEWKEHARGLIEWVKTTPKWPKYEVHGALVTTEQGDGKTFCCNLPNQCCDSHSARLAGVEAIYYAKTGDASYKEAAYRTDNWVTYWQGLPGKAHAPFSEQWWFTDEFADGPRRMMDALWAVPEWAPEGESHLLGSSSVVKRVEYGRGRVGYSTFDKEGVEVLRLDFVPDKVTVGGKVVPRRMGMEREGWVFDEKTRVLRVRHVAAGDVEISGVGGAEPVELVTFDSPHLTVGTGLVGVYGGVDWGKGGWEIAAPGGKFGTFGLRMEGAKGELGLAGGRVFAGVDVYNGGEAAARLRIRAEGETDVVLVLKAGELKRVRPGWSGATGNVEFGVEGGEVRFDNVGVESAGR
jgi:hypothetical protein